MECGSGGSGSVSVGGWVSYLYQYAFLAKIQAWERLQCHREIMDFRTRINNISQSPGTYQREVGMGTLQPCVVRSCS